MHFGSSGIEKMICKDWRAGDQSKVQGTWNLHTLLPSGIEPFKHFSSVSAVVGAAATASHPTGNTYIDAFVRREVSYVRNATSLDLEWMLSEGAVAESEFLIPIL